MAMTDRYKNMRFVYPVLFRALPRRRQHLSRHTFYFPPVQVERFSAQGSFSTTNAKYVNDLPRIRLCSSLMILYSFFFSVGTQLWANGGGTESLSRRRSFSREGVRWARQMSFSSQLPESEQRTRRVILDFTHVVSGQARVGGSTGVFVYVTRGSFDLGQCGCRMVGDICVNFNLVLSYMCSHRLRSWRISRGFSDISLLVCTV